MTRTPALYVLTNVTVGSTLRRVWRPQVAGLEHIPAGGAILCPNHQTVGDQLFLGVTVPRHIAFWAKAEYFRATGPRGWLTRHAVTGMGAIPVERAGGRAVLSAFDAAVPILRAGGLVAVFPEGTRSPDGRLYRGRTGAVRLAAQAGVPIVPVGILGTREARPADILRPKRRPISITFGPALDVAGRAQTPREARARTDELMATIQAMTGQEYVPAYAPSSASRRRSIAT
ncbi:1-acyl-sn-glycerol-3-phosphate acyltransferase [Actinoplanes lutulentus]|uniref:1-acyl-sn-glycerol-3-phosphate acyltransferase n=1 Tax=Actinoplanes lutulentus TaxID=1287878 RepID=A0A327Z1T9_9ACTN|nr:lysophospholipid acyltransferase family protein [Actinoplanes lutulentus]MBB2943008.1 1-acyl-sn-glycerol-3-phosphate acyltransferase [Actinoplanes lutulentus]RAK26725.1 1-acyl-sn-glycerol-3-phosphate acyltransferase [Actinoplanes lutulentus]